jgi:hypothetical protein
MHRQRFRRAFTSSCNFKPIGEASRKQLVAGVRFANRSQKIRSKAASGGIGRLGRKIKISPSGAPADPSKSGRSSVAEHSKPNPTPACSTADWIRIRVETIVQLSSTGPLSPPGSWFIAELQPLLPKGTLLGWFLGLIKFDQECLLGLFKFRPPPVSNAHLESRLLELGLEPYCASKFKRLVVPLSV